MKLNRNKILNQTSFICIILLALIYKANCAGTDAITFKTRDLYELQVAAWVATDPAKEESFISFLTVSCANDQYKIPNPDDPDTDKKRNISEVTCNEGIKLSTVKFSKRADLTEALGKFPELEDSTTSGDQLTKEKLNSFLTYLADKELEITQIVNPPKFAEAEYTSDTSKHTLQFDNFKVTHDTAPFELNFKLTFKTDPTEETDESKKSFVNVELTDYELHKPDSVKEYFKTVLQKKEIENLLEEVKAYMKDKESYKTKKESEGDDNGGKGSDGKPEDGKPEGNDGKNDEDKDKDKDEGGGMKNVLIALVVGGVLVIIIGTIFFLKRRSDVEKKNRKAMGKNISVE